MRRLHDAARSVCAVQPGRRTLVLDRRICSRPWQAQQWALVVGALSVSATVLAQPAGTSRTMSLQPSIAVTQTFSSNYLGSDSNQSSDAITRLSAGLGFRSQAGLVRGFLDYSLSSLIYARHRDHNTFQNSLNAALGTVLLEGRARIDLNANIAQSAISAFGAQPTASGMASSNITEQRQLQILPSFKGQLGPSLRYAADLSVAIADARNTDKGDSTLVNVGLHLEPNLPSQLSWSLDATGQKSDYKAGRKTSSERLFSGLALRLDDFDLRLLANAGLEFTDLATAGRQRYQTWGIGATWTPSPRTQVVAQFDQRFFGAARSLSLTHRTPLTVWRVSNSRSVSASGNQDLGSGRGTAFELLFAQFASIEPDLGRRVDLVNGYLRAQGIDPLFSPGFLKSTATVQDRQEISAAWRAQRSTALFAFSQTMDQQLGLVTGALDDLSNSTQVRLQTLSLDLSHRLTPVASASMLLSRQAGTGSQAAQRHVQRLLSLQYTTRPNNEANFSLGLRRRLSNNQPAAYDETSVFATFGLRF